MKKRLRKKLHKGEYKETGISIRINADQATASRIVDILTDIVDKNGLVFCGGGIGHIMVPSEQYDAFTMPSKIEHLMLFLIAVPDTSADCIMGYFFDPVNKRIIPDKTAAIKAALGSVDYQINCDIDLWN